MTSFFWSLFAYSGWLACLVSLLPARRVWRIPAGVLALAVAWPATYAVRGVLADPAYTTGLLAWTVAMCRFLGVTLPGARMRRADAVWLLILFWALNISALSSMPIDLYYEPGFAHPVACLAIVIAAASPGLRRISAYTLVVPVAALLSASGLHESRNVWDHVMDPSLALWALIEFGLSFRRAEPGDARAQLHPGVSPASLKLADG